MPETNLPLALVAEITRTASTTSQKITRLRLADCYVLPELFVDGAGTQPKR